jgi:hypothetical protein
MGSSRPLMLCRMPLPARTFMGATREPLVAGTLLEPSVLKAADVTVKSWPCL